ncbi:ribosomal protection-like ABC-F family protein [Anaerofustis sp. LCP19S3_F7]|uniref:ribosomal protection-like ABC-F family protein n=1 Tax=Anaerofustis sp. LCP19S3_F7 TaxID=3440247 RepID=UPI003F8E9BDD
MSTIKIQNLTFSHEGSYENIFENLSINLDTSWKLGLIAKNGRGKTTFLKLLMNEYDYKGSISKNIEFEYFPFEIKNKNRMSIEIIEDINPNFEYWELSKELNMLSAKDEIIYKNFNELSKGEQVKLMLAVLFTKPNNFLLIDEPTNHLDVYGRETLIKYLNKKKGYIIVSHDRNLLNNVTDHILSINKNKIDLQKGNFDSYMKNKEREDSFEISKNEKLKKEISHMEMAAKQTSSWASKVEKTKYNTKNISGLKVDRGYIGHKSAKMMKTSKSINKRINKKVEEKKSLLKNIEHSEDLKISPIYFHSDNFIRLNHISLFYDKKDILRDITFQISNKDRIILQGKNGSGKSSIIKLITDENISYEGDFYKAKNLKISYIPQDTSFLKGSMDNFIKENQINETIFKTNLIKLNFERKDFGKNLEIMSQGEKKKILIAKSLSEQAHLYIWDEPLNYIDVFSRMQIENLILAYLPTMLIIEHDKTFINKINTEIIKL